MKPQQYPDNYRDYLSAFASSRLAGYSGNTIIMLIRIQNDAVSDTTKAEYSYIR
jgi:hypothetical protein